MVRHRMEALLLAFVLSACHRAADAVAQQPGSVRPSPPAGVSPQPIRAVASTDLDSSRRTAIVAAVQRVKPAVVSIRVTLPAPQPSPWDMFTGQDQESPEAFGTGFIIRSDGVILTNQHVVANALQINVTLADGTDLPGRLLGDDPVTDIAVIKVARAGLPVATIGHSSDLMIGEWAIALGNPYVYMLGNSDPTVTAGVISATGRNIVPTGNNTGSYLDMIQTDAAINPGNSGGPLVNSLGEVVGVNSSIFSGTGESVGLGFAIPIERAIRVANEIIQTGTVRRAWVGLSISGGRNSAIEPGNGLVVSQVAPGSPASRAGINGGDVLLKANGRTLRNYLDWDAVRLDLDVGDSVALTVQQDGKKEQVRIAAGDLPTATAQKVRILKDVDLITLTPAIRSERSILATWGALIYHIPQALADNTGLQEGDVIIGINNQALRTAEDVAKAFQAMQPGESFTLNVERSGMRFPLQLVFQ